MNVSQFLRATALVGLVGWAPGVALAQSTSATAPAQTTSDTVAAQTSAGDPSSTNQSASDRINAGSPGSQADGNDVVVTGSRIASPNATSTSPITSITPAQILDTARVSLGDSINTLPQFRSTYSQANSTRFLGTAGLNLLDLYGLGTQRTLVLVNGRRHVASDVLVNATSVDINTIPVDLIEGIDTVTGGDSAVYGSDAIAGVVNFRLKDHFQGLEARAQGGISQYGDAGTYFASVLAGKNFAEDRGNIAIDVEYARQNILYASGRPATNSASGFVTTDTDPAGIAVGQTLPNYDGIPDAVFFKNIRSATIAAGGLVTFAAPTTGSTCGTDNTGIRFSCNYLFQPDGTLVPQTGSRVGIGTNSSSPSGSSFLGGNGYNRNSGQLVQIQPALDRYSANLIGHFEISPALVPFIEATYSRTDSYGQGSSGPAFITGATDSAFSQDVYERPALSNPYLSAQARAQIQAALILGGTSAATANNLNTRFTLRENLEGLGVRSEQARRQTYRIVGGVRGQFNSDWHYEVSANYGEFTESTRVLGNIDTQRLLLALDAQRNSAGQIVCGSQLDATRAFTDYAGNAAKLAADVAACQPLNPFGTGNVSQAARNYILKDTVSYGKLTQLDISGFINGNTGKFFNLPGGPIGFVAGGEYRRETNYFRPDPLVSAGYTFYNALGSFTPPAFEVKEGYAEVELPVLKDLPFFRELTLKSAARVSNYNSAAGTNFTYNAGGSWSPIQDITFRANYSRSTRAPNLSELYSPQNQNFATVSDPCSANFIGTGTQYRAANCAAAGIPTTYNYLYQQSIQIVSGGNPKLNVETSDSYTYGIALKPRFVSGLVFSVDYYNIKVNNVITAPSAQQILNSCYDGPTLSTQFCGLFQRVAAGATGPRGEEQYRVIEGSLQQTLLNYANYRVRGIDFNLNYFHDFGKVKFSSLLAYTYQLENDQFTDPSQPNFGTDLLASIGYPKHKVYWNINALIGAFDITTRFNYLSRMSVGAITDLISYQGRPPQNADDYSIPYYPDVFYVSGRIGLNVMGGSQFYVGMDNITNRLPPLGSTGIGGGTGAYDPIGRRVYAGFKAKF